MKNCTKVLFLILLIFSYAKAQEGGYTDQMSVKQGDDISFFISTKQPTYTLTINRFEDTLVNVLTVQNLVGGERVVPESAYVKGCNWPLSYKLTIPNDWIPGAYSANFKTSINTYRIVFFVKAKNPGAYSKVLFIASTNTWQAYNPYGGKSLYDYNSTDTIRAPKVSTQRPSFRSAGYAEFVRSERLFIRWMYNNNISADYAVDYDLHANPNYLENYKILIIVGHSEYWSYPQRVQVEKFIRAGGKVMVISGNTCWWQVRFEDDGKTIVCYKDLKTDPLRGITDSLVTYNWYLPPINNIESKFLGAAFIFGGYVNNKGFLLASDGYSDYAAFNSWHWVYKNTGLIEGEEFGFDEHIVGNEVDGLPLSWNNGVPVLANAEFAPANIKILALSPAKPENLSLTSTPNGVMSLYFNTIGGAVFNAGSINFSAGLQNFFMSKILKNVYDHFNSNIIPPEINTWSPSNVIPFTTNNWPVSINKRDYLYKTAQNLNFSVSASDPKGRNIDYKWLVNGVLNGEGPQMNYSYDPNNSGKVTIITAKVSNEDDSSTLSWQIFNTELAFSEFPPKEISKKTLYKWRVQVFNSYNDHLNYVFSGPSWLTFKDGFISGISPDSGGIYNISLQVSNSHNQTDELNYSINVSNISNVETINPEEFVLYQNYPNPFNPSTNIKFTVPNDGQVSLKIYDIIGREVAVLINRYQSKGTYNITFNADKLSSGVYFYRLSAGSRLETKKFVIQR